MPATVLDQARRWLRECYDQGGPRGKIFIGNLATDLTIGAVDSTLCLEFLTGVCKQLATTSESADHSQTPIILDSP